MVPKYPAARARINRNGSDSSGSEISCDTGYHLDLDLIHVSDDSNDISWDFLSSNLRSAPAVYSRLD